MTKWGIAAVGLLGLTACTFESGSECGREVTIDPPDCTLVISSAEGNYWEVEVNGTVTGPAPSELSVAAEGATDVATTCATWSPDQRHTCIRQTDEGEQDNWMATLRFPTGGATTFDIEAKVKDAAGAECADQVTASETVFCE